MKIIDNPEEIYFSELGGADVTVIFYMDDEKKLFNSLEWKSIEPDHIVTLDMIREQIEDKYGKNLIVVIAEYPLRGEIFRYGNYEDNRWVRIGKVCGYA
ncbi:MAG: hypothetical protein H2212_00105 [Ruminococcus sp.]|nr:hypothetical protein [Ruminococcus sp.]